MGAERVQVGRRRVGEGDLEGGRRGPAGAVRRSADASLVAGRSDDPRERDADRFATEALASRSERVGYLGRGGSPTRIRRATFAGPVIGAEGGTADGQLTSRIRRTEVAQASAFPPSRFTASRGRMVRRLAIPRAVTGLKDPVDTSPPEDFAAVVDTLYNEDVLLEMQGLIEAEQKKPELTQADTFSIALALRQIRLRLQWLAERRAEWPSQREPNLRVQPTDKRYKTYGVEASLDQAVRLIDNAVNRLGSITPSTSADDPTMRIFRSFFKTAKPGGVMGRLRYVKNQIRHYRPQCPYAYEPNGGGHVCLDPAMAENWKYQYFNDGLGSDARMVIGPKAMKMTPGARAYNVVHEATHATRGLTTVDHAYRWQRIFLHLSPQQQLENADSYAMLVGVLGGLTEATVDMTDDEQLLYDLPPQAVDVETVGLSPDLSAALKHSWAWFEYYATELYKNFTALHAGVKSPEQFVKGSYQERLYDVTADVYALGPKDTDTEAVSVVEKIATDADVLSKYSAYAKPVFCTGAPAAPLDKDRFAMVVPTSIGTDLTSMILWHIREKCPPTGRPADLYDQLVPRVVKMSKWAGPLST